MGGVGHAPESGSGLAHGADLLVHEATFLEEDAERAAETSHSTALAAARLAAALARAEAEKAARAPTRVTLLDVPTGERPLRNVAPGAYFTP